MLQAAAAADEVVPVVPPTDSPQRAYMSSLQGQEPQPQSQEAQEEIVTHRRPPDRYPIKSYLVLVVTLSVSANFINNEESLHEVTCNCNFCLGSDRLERF